MTVPTDDNYNPNVPQPKDVFSTSQEPFLNNFGDIYDAFLKNHVPLDAASNAGNHTILQMLQQTGQFQTDAGQISVYSKDIPNQTDQIYLRFQGNQTEFQFTNYQIYPLFDVNNPPNDNIPYFTFLPNNILVYFGVFTYNTQPSSQLFLKPGILKNIVGMNFCPMGTVAGYPPGTTLGSTDNVHINIINLYNPPSSGIPFPFKYSYFIAGNI